MEKETSWDDGFMLSAACIYYKRPVKIIYSDGVKSTNVNEHQGKDVKTAIIDSSESASDDKPIYLGYVNLGYEKKDSDRTKNHYVSLVPAPFALDDAHDEQQFC